MTSDLAPMEQRFSTRKAAKLVQLSERQVRAYARAGLIGPRAQQQPAEPTRSRTLEFDFQDLAVLRVAQRLLTQGLTAPRIGRALEAVREQLPAAQPLSSVQLEVTNGKLIAQMGSLAWEPETGQQVLGLREPVPQTTSPESLAAVRSGAPSVGATDELTSLLRGIGEPAAADEWFDIAMGLEESEPHRAYEGYLRALACNPEHVEASINIGRLCSAAGDHARATAYFRMASRIDPAHPVAHFNMAVTLHDVGRLDDALAAYRTALIHDPHFADAHYNIAALLVELGRRDEADEHLRAYDKARTGGDPLPG